MGVEVPPAAPCDAAAATAAARGLITFKGTGGGLLMLSLSLEDVLDSIRFGGGRAAPPFDAAALLLPGRGEKLPGALGGGLACCIVKEVEVSGRGFVTSWLRCAWSYLGLGSPSLCYMTVGLCVSLSEGLSCVLKGDATGQENGN
jgi:hypothetical protein